MFLNFFNRSKKDSPIFKELAPYMNLGIQWGVTVGLGALLGWWLDKHFDSSPLWIIICSLAGVLIGMYTFFKTVLDLEKKKKQKKK